jgi:hypothetical protein
MVKTKTYDADLLRQIQVQLNNLTQVATTFTPNRPVNNVQTNSNTNPPAAPAANQFGHLRPGQAVTSTATGPNALYPFCLFCGSPSTEHMMRNCPTLEQYIRDGKCMRNAQGRVALPDGQDIPKGVRGRWIKDRLDYYEDLFGRPTQLNTMFEVANDIEIMQYELGRSEDDSNEDAQIAVLQAQLDKAKEDAANKKKRAKNVRFEGVRVPPLPPWAKGSTSNTKESGPPMVPIDKSPSTSLTIDETISTTDAMTNSTTKPTMNTAQTNQTNPSTAQTNKGKNIDNGKTTNSYPSTAPQYRYQAANRRPSPCMTSS